MANMRYLVLALLILAACAQTETMQVEQTEPITADGEQIGEMHVKADIRATIDCGGMDCFEEKFRQCEPATVNLELMQNVAYKYEIIGPEEGSCEVKSQFIKNPNPEWIGKKMTCLYDNTQPFDKAVQDRSRCQGPLHTLMS